MKNVYSPSSVARSVTYSIAARFLFIQALLLMLSACASTFNTSYTLKNKSPVYLSSNSKDEYYFSLTVARMLEHSGVRVVKDATQSAITINIRGPECKSHVLFTDASGQRTDYRLSCVINYTIKRNQQGEAEEEAEEEGGSEGNEEYSANAEAPSAEAVSVEAKNYVRDYIRAFALLSRTSNINAYFRIEEEAYKTINEKLARQLVAALATSDL